MSERESGRRVAINRRQLLSAGAAAGLSGGIAALASEAAVAQEAAAPERAAPRLEIARLDEIEVGAALDFFYPDDDSPAILLRLRDPVEGGQGPDQSLVAFSTLCTHKGCPVGWNPEQEILICPCHWSSFDPAKGGRLIIGQASSGLPAITLQVAAGKIYATGVEGLIFGRQTNIL
ncbi:MAG: hypothetical protein Kow0058_10840 [Roseovarius sp.]